MYFNTVPGGYRMLRHPNMLVQFYFRNLVKFSLSKYMKRNVYLERAKKSGKAVGRTSFPMNSSIQRFSRKSLPENRSFAVGMVIASLLHVSMRCSGKKGFSIASMISC